MYRHYKTKSIEQASTIKTAKKLDPELSFDETGIATFTFPEKPEVVNVVMNYEFGFLVDARTVLNTRNQLLRRVKGAQYGKS
jgi:hypothetical protein